MRTFRQLLFALSLVVGTVCAQTAFQDDPVDFYVSDNGTNDALAQVNMLICYMTAMAPDKMVNRGAYVANIYEDECKVDDKSAADQAAATPTSAQTASNTGSSASGSSGANREEREVTSSIIEVTRADENSPMIAKVWVDIPGQEADPGDEMSSAFPPMLIYVKGSQSAAPSATARFGEFEMQMSYTLAEAFAPPGGPSMPAGTGIGGAYLSATANSVVFKDEMMMAPPSGLKATFSGSSVSGVYNQMTGIWDESTQTGSPIQLVQKFALNETDKVYCTDFIKAYKLDFENLDSSGAPAKADYTPTGSDGLTTDSACYSMALEDAQRAVHRYGVYKADGSRLVLGQGGFPMKADVTVSGATQTVHAYADYWGVHFPSRFSSAVKLDSDASPTIFTKEQFLGETGTPPTYTIAQANAKIEQVTRSFVALSSLDGLTAVMFVDGADSFWGTQFVVLGFAASNAEYQGKYTHSNETWTFDKKITFEGGYTETAITPITFTNATWLSTMKKTFENGPGTEDDHTEVRGLWVWSPDSGKGYDIKKNSIENPTDGSGTNGIIVRTNKTVTPTDFPAELHCVQQCLTAALLNASIQAAVDGAAGATVASPFAEENFGVLKGTSDANEKGRMFPGILATNVKKYTTSGLKVLDAAGTELAVAASVTSESQLKAAKFFWPWDDGASFSQQLSHGIGTGSLLSEADLAKIECKKNTDGTYQDEHPEFDAGAKRYCPDLLMDPSVDVSSWYEVRVGPNSWDRQRFLKDQATSAYVAFTPPTRLYYDVWDETKYGTDAGKTISLDYQGFGELHGIPGEVIDTRTGESKGQFIEEWSQYYRYVQRFMIESSASGVAPKLSEGGSSTTTYDVKALQGEEWLLKKPSSFTPLTMSGTEADLPAVSVLVDISPNGEAANQIGAKPTTLLNDGKPAVIHKEVVITLD